VSSSWATPLVVSLTCRVDSLQAVELTLRAVGVLDGEAVARGVVAGDERTDLAEVRGDDVIDRAVDVGRYLLLEHRDRGAGLAHDLAGVGRNISGK
jgi:hypothetical protein